MNWFLLWFTEDWLAFLICVFALCWIVWMIRDIIRYNLITNKVIAAVKNLLTAQTEHDELLAMTHLCNVMEDIHEVDPQFLDTEQLQYLRDMANITKY